MAKAARKSNFSSFKYDKDLAGRIPGYFEIPQSAHQTKVHVFAFCEDFFLEKEIHQAQEIEQLVLQYPKAKFWVDLQGFKDLKPWLATHCFGKISNIELEDIIAGNQRPKIEEFPDHLFMVCQMLYYDDNKELITEQLSMVLTERCLITFQENYIDKLDPIRLRLRQGNTKIRQKSISYIAFCLLDVTIDHYFSILSDIGEELEKIEANLLENNYLSRTYILRIKRELLTLKRAAWPTRDLVNECQRSEFELLDSDLKYLFRDLYDHVIQNIDLVETNRELTTSLMDLYMSSISNRMNEIMKFLTMVSTVFIPLSFIVGLYGMNFSHTDDKNNPLPYNMPELHHPYGYVIVVSVMIVIVLWFLWFFNKKGWIK
jgi:magnesium transporter